MLIQVQSVFRSFIGHPLYRLFFNTLTYGFGRIIQSLMSLLLLPIYTRYLNPSDYGVIALLGLASLVLTTITMLALTNGIARYFYYPDKENTTVDKVVWSPTLFIAVISFLVLGIAFQFAPMISQFLVNSTQYA